MYRYPGTKFNLLGIFLAFCLIMDMASRLGKVQMSIWLLTASLPLLASKTAMGVALALSFMLSAMVDRVVR